MRRLVIFILCCALFASAVILYGCRTEQVMRNENRPLPPRPRAVPPTPPTAVVSRMAFMVGSKPEDTNGNGFPDLIRVTVALFSMMHPLAVDAGGAFTFELYPQGQFGIPDTKPVGVWKTGPHELPRLRAVAQYGPCYQFQLSLLELGSDVMPLDQADLICRFYPADGSAMVQSDGVRTIQLGRRYTAGIP